MKVQKTQENNEIEVTFVPETKEEKRIMGTLRNHYFYGDVENGTFPEYNGITSDDNYVTSMKFKFKTFKHPTKEVTI